MQSASQRPNDVMAVRGIIDLILIPRMPDVDIPERCSGFAESAGRCTAEELAPALGLEEHDSSLTRFAAWCGVQVTTPS